MGAIGAMAVCFGSGVCVQMTPTPAKGTFGFKHLLWGVHSSLLGAFIFPAIAIYGPFVGQAAMLTGGALAGSPVQINIDEPSLMVVQCFQA